MICLKILDTNLPSILLKLSTNVPYAPRSYAGFSDFQSKKVKKVCEIILVREKYKLLVKYTSYSIDSDLFISRYELYLPNRDEWKRLIRTYQ